jgi:hypothetical protein
MIAMLFILPTIIGMSLLWKSPRDKTELLAGLSIVSAPLSCFGDADLV